jgi:diphthamide biosynthesis protein 7
MELLQSIKSHSTAFLDRPPSCLEFCPTFPDYLVTGTYLLSEGSAQTSGSAESTRSGSLQLFKLDPESWNL